MTEISRPIVALLEAALVTPTGSLATDIVRLRESLVVALRRCLDDPGAGWPHLVASAAGRGGWDQWRVASLLAAADPDADSTPDETRDALAALVDELIGRRDVLAGPWEGRDRQAVLLDPHWLAGRDRRELVFAIERTLGYLAGCDAPAIRHVAIQVDERDPGSVVYPGLSTALVGCAADLEAGPSIGASSRQRLRNALADSPFAAAVDLLP